MDLAKRFLQPRPFLSSGAKYELPYGMTKDNVESIVNDLICNIKRRELTTRQCQKIFLICADYILESKPEKTEKEKYRF